MKLVIVRHADPDYTIDSLTLTGRKEAKLLSERLVKLAPFTPYCSPLGRAKKTASYTLKKLGMEAEILPWLTEFEGRVKESNGKENVCWDRLPSYWTEQDIYYTDKWYESDTMSELNVKEKYDAVCKGIDELLAKHGYVHEGRHFRVTNSNHDTVVLFCHFGVEAAIMSHLFSMSPMILWHNFVALPSSVTTIYTEEREEGIATFRTAAFGDLSHLYVKDQKPSFAARFCECFKDKTRH